MSLSDQERYALFAQSVYRMNDPLKSKETRMADAMSVISDGGVTGFDMDRSESNSKRGVFVNNDTKEVIISHRGTDPSMAANLTTDAAIALGVEGFTRRYKNARDRDAETIAKYPDHKVSLTGHSLGGAVAAVALAAQGEGERGAARVRCKVGRISCEHSVFVFGWTRIITINRLNTNNGPKSAK